LELRHGRRTDHDIPTVSELIDRIMSEAERLIRDRLPNCSAAARPRRPRWRERMRRGAITLTVGLALLAFGLNDGFAAEADLPEKQVIVMRIAASSAR
jgi:hypothetical protein